MSDLISNKNSLSSVESACLEIRFLVKGVGTVGAVIPLFRLQYKTSVICHFIK